MGTFRHEWFDLLRTGAFFEEELMNLPVFVASFDYTGGIDGFSIYRGFVQQQGADQEWRKRNDKRARKICEKIPAIFIFVHSRPPLDHHSLKNWTYLI